MDTLPPGRSNSPGGVGYALESEPSEYASAASSTTNRSRGADGSSCTPPNDGIYACHRLQQLAWLMLLVVDLSDLTQNAAHALAKDVDLYPHQVSGCEWVALQERGKMRGGILADDMG